MYMNSVEIPTSIPDASSLLARGHMAQNAWKRPSPRQPAALGFLTESKREKGKKDP